MGETHDFGQLRRGGRKHDRVRRGLEHGEPVALIDELILRSREQVIGAEDAL
jgi:hypothetical protein